jgi:hypothetical protein
VVQIAAATARIAINFCIRFMLPRPTQDVSKCDLSA